MKIVNKHIQGISKYGSQGRKANLLGSQILNRHGYITQELNNSDLDLDLDFPGIDEFILKSKVPEEDPLQLKDLENHLYDMALTIDYKSNNLRDINSIYVKLKPYVHQNSYFEYTRKDETIDPILKYFGKKGCKHYYTNNQILSWMNRSDLIVYLKYNTYEKDLHLKQAYLIGRDTLKKQVLNILNQVLEEAGYPLISNNEGSLRLNQKITLAYLRVRDDPTILKRDIELLRIPETSRHNSNIMLRIPERYLTNYIKVDKDGEIS